MLRRKLLLILGSMVVAWLVAGVAAILMLDSVLGDLDRVRADAMAASAETAGLLAAVGELDRSLLGPSERLGEGDGRAARGLGEAIDRLGRLLEGVDGAAAHLTEMERAHGLLGGVLGALARGEGGPSGAELRRRALGLTGGFREEVAGASRVSREHADVRQARATVKLRVTALVLGATFLLLINGSILMLSWAVTMILRPVDQLVEATRRLAREDFGARVEFTLPDEFGELARAYNQLAEQLESNELQKVETLRQVACTLTHELNNAMSIIEMQLAFAARSAGRADALAPPLHQIHATLQEMRGTVADLARVRRIVLTDYMDGVKMLDLRRSVEAGSDDPPITTRAGTGY